MKEIWADLVDIWTEVFIEQGFDEETAAQKAQKYVEDNDLLKEYLSERADYYRQLNKDRSV